MLHSLCICYFGALHRQHSCTSEEWGHRFQQRAAAMDKADIQNISKKHKQAFGGHWTSQTFRGFTTRKTK